MSATKYTRAAALGGTLAACAAVAKYANAAQYEFKCATDLPTDHPTTVWQLQMWKAIERESGGRIHTLLFPNSQLGSDTAMVTQMRAGALPFLLANAGPFSAVVTSSAISTIGFLFKNSDDAVRVMSGKLGDYVRQDALSKGIFIFPHMWDSGMQHLTSGTHPIQSADDLRGFKVRVSNTRSLVDLFKTLGANPSPLDVSEVYTALQTKLIDGEGGGLAAMEGLRWFEVQKYLSLTYHAFGAFWFVANNDVWKGLPRDVQEIIERNAAKYVALEHRDMTAVDLAVLNKLGRQGLTINRTDQASFRARLKPYYETWAQTFGPTAWGLLEESVGRLT